jgi:hypothetical protein
MLHGAHGPHAAERRAVGHLEGGLLVDRVFEMKPGLARQPVQGVADFGCGRSGIGRGHGHTRLEGAADHGLVPDEQELFPLPGTEDPMHGTPPLIQERGSRTRQFYGFISQFIYKTKNII